MINVAGQRLLGVIVAQILACAEAIAQCSPDRKIHLTGSGWTISFATLVAAGLRPDLCKTLTLYANVKSIYHPMVWGERFEAVEALCCFGLLEVADVPQLKALLEGIELRQPGGCLKEERLS